MTRFAKQLFLLCLMSSTAGCDLLYFAIADLTHPDQVQTVDITWANSQDLCASFVDRSEREAWLVHGDLDALGTHEPVPLLTPSSAKASDVGDIAGHQERSQIPLHPGGAHLLQ